MMTWKKILYLFILICIASTLINSFHFGKPVYTSFFLFAGLVSITAILAFAVQLLFPTRHTYRMPSYIKIFLLLVLYVFLHGFFSGYIGLTHYFWLASGIFICIASTAAGIGTGDNQATAQNNLTTFLFWGIAVLVLTECMLVFFQLAGLLNSVNIYFTASGSCMNPNVTAMFLSVSLSAIIWLIKNAQRKAWKLLAYINLLLTIVTIGLLKCRSAYMVTFILLTAEALPVISKIYRKQLKPGIGLLTVALIAIALAIGAGVVSVEKKTSAINRIGIWKTSVDMIAQKPLWGYGFDAFEKEYNLFSATKNNPINDFINMPYNDFFELAIEGGLPAMLLWVIFLASVFYFYYKRKQRGFMLPLLLGCIMIQVSNFIFQALPVMALLIVYLAVGPYLTADSDESEVVKEGADRKRSIVYATALILTASVLAFITFPLGYGFYQTNQIEKKLSGLTSIQAYKRIEKYAEGYAFYHTSLGNAYLQESDIENARKQYLLALRYNSEESVLDNCGYCYQMIGRYDSSEYYYTTLRNMTPHKFGPRFRLLKLFEQKGDTLKAMKIVKEIDSMPIKVNGQAVEYIKRYAQVVLQRKASK
jgi:O-antigen polymerase